MNTKTRKVLTVLAVVCAVGCAGVYIYDKYKEYENDIKVSKVIKELKEYENQIRRQIQREC